MSLPSTVNLVEVGPRDGLQNQKKQISTETKIDLIKRLGSAGLKRIEATSFVSPKWVPQMSDATEVMQAIRNRTEANYTVLTPNLKGFEQALAAGAREVAIFTSASQGFSQKNINCSVEESIARFQPIVERANVNNIKVRGYVSCVVGCPYEGHIDPKQVYEVVARLLDLGCYEVSLGDTIGVGTPNSIESMLEPLLKTFSVELLAGHYHNTYGTALANVYASMKMGISTFDSSIGGLGGCPYAKGASGNIATEDLVWFLSKMNIETNIELEKLLSISTWLKNEEGLTISSQVFNALI
jgi:hydroxymethylglutaryl-CoA lyase